MVYQFYCMALYHSQTRRHIINVFRSHQYTKGLQFLDNEQTNLLPWEILSNFWKKYMFLKKSCLLKNRWFFKSKHIGLLLPKFFFYFWMSCYKMSSETFCGCSLAFKPGLEVIKLEYSVSLKLKIKCNDWLLTDTCDTCPQAANHCALFWVWEWTQVL